MFKKFSKIGSFVIFLACFSKFSFAETPQLLFPVACSLGQDCWSVNYVDVDPVEGAVKDFKCGPKSYEGHKGTDFALRSLADVEAGVDVLAAADGTVLRFRDGEEDSLKTQQQMEEIKAQTKECGNGVFLDHGNGLRTIYCHLKKGSLVVKRGQKVKAGQKLAQVGQSGFSEFPHLHFGVVWEGGVIDPYTGLLNTDGCGREKESLWALGLPMEYEGGAIFDAGFRASKPDFEAIKKGEKNPETLSSASSAFVFWAAFYGLRAGDEVHLKVTNEQGQVFIERIISHEKDRARQYYYTGRRLSEGLPAGEYRGTAALKTIDGQEQTIKRTIRVE